MTMSLKKKLSKFSTLSRKEMSLPASIAPIDKTFAYENGIIQEDLAMPGFLSVKELNSLLLKYIGQVRDLEVDKDGTIKERDLIIEGLKAEISKLQANLNSFHNQKEIDESQIKVRIVKQI